MSKEEFLTELSKKLSGLPESDIRERVDFYREMIEDHVEDGISEDEAVAEIGNVDEIVAQIMSEVSLTRLVKERVRPKRKLKTWEIVRLCSHMGSGDLRLCSRYFFGGRSDFRRFGDHAAPQRGKCHGSFLLCRYGACLCGACDTAVFWMCMDNKACCRSDRQDASES